MATRVTQTASGAIAEFVCEAQVPASAAFAARLRLLDAAGIIVAAGNQPSTLVAGRGAPDAYGSGRAVAFGMAQRLAPAGAAMVNGVRLHGLDFDDTHLASIVHVSAAVVPATLAMADHLGSSADEVTRALAVGSEVSCRVGEWSPASLHKAGFHPTSVIGVFGAAAAVSSLLRLGPEQVINATGLCGSLAGGILQLEDSWLKVWHGGWAAQGGIVAALAGRDGFLGPRHPLEGEDGLFQTHVGARPAGPLSFDGDWHSEAITLKRYPCCHFLHSAIECGRQLHNTGIDARDLRSVTVRLPALAIDQVGLPAEVRRRPANAYKAKFAGHWVLARTLITGEVTLATFDEAMLEDPATLALADRIELVEHDFPNFPRDFPARVEALTASGEPVAASADGRAVTISAEGEPAVREKFLENAVAGGSDPDHARRAMEIVLGASSSAQIWNALEVR